MARKRREKNVEMVTCADCEKKIREDEAWAIHPHVLNVLNTHAAPQTAGPTLKGLAEDYEKLRSEPICGKCGNDARGFLGLLLRPEIADADADSQAKSGHHFYVTRPYSIELQAAEARERREERTENGNDDSKPRQSTYKFDPTPGTLPDGTMATCVFCKREHGTDFVLHGKDRKLFVIEALDVLDEDGNIMPVCKAPECRSQARENFGGAPMPLAKMIQVAAAQQEKATEVPMTPEPIETPAEDNEAEAS